MDSSVRGRKRNRDITLAVWNSAIAQLELCTLIDEVLASRLAPAARKWLRDMLGSSKSEDFYQAFALVRRTIGSNTLNLTPAEISAMLGKEWLVHGRRTDELGRILLLVQAANQTGDSAIVEICYRQGDTLERQAVLRALALLPNPAGYCSLAIDACRTHIKPLFEGIACENPYPAAYFPDLHFNQMILKAMFLGVALKRVRGLNARLTPELSRMAEDYRDERLAAGRSIPDDLKSLIT